MVKPSLAQYVLAIVLGALGMVSCHSKDFAIVDGDVNVLENPLPLSFSESKTYANPPATLPANRIVAVLRKGQTIELLGRKYGKDFLAYEVQLPDGRRGYLIHGDSFLLSGSPE
ncbi:MAG TPA: hypothetical protein PK614_08540 [Nitrospira sp.]|nr:hypothetical protein [Nitrospira sp.]